MRPRPAPAFGTPLRRSRPGSGARQDATQAPAESLLLARRGMAFFARALNMLTDEGLAGQSRVPGWSRAHVVASVSIAARSQALALTDLRGGAKDDEFDWDPDIGLTATLPPRALRHLYEHTHVHLNVEWRDLTSGDWARQIDVPPDPGQPVRNLPMLQASRLWWGAVALGASASRDEVPLAVGLPPGPLQGAIEPPGTTPHPISGGR